ncbi:hypothetical protein GCM10022215_08210 [Nocardioides fonticola]|uniref:Uncharacterized protein n=1 Tax=Nocardioides fonticola TaxID=450363 RepID=A0ABP7XDJ2_9ACTN
MTVRRHRVTLLVLALVAVLGAVIAWPASGRGPGASESVAGLVAGMALTIALLLIGHYRLGVDLPADVHSARPLVPRPSSAAVSVIGGIAAAVVAGVLYAVGRSTSSPGAVPTLLAGGAVLFLALQLLSRSRRV